MEGDRQVGDAPIATLLEEDARRQLCGGQVLLRICLAWNEVASLKEPVPHFALVSRLSYVPCLFNDLKEHFSGSIPPRLGRPYEIWLDYEGTPLKWHVPLGVLCDILVGADVPSPLHLTVHFQGQEGLRPFASIGDLQGAVMSAISSATYMQHASATIYGKLGIKDSNQLWDSILKTNLDAYWSVQKKLWCSKLQECKSLPVRLHLCGPEHMPMLHPAPPIASNGRVQTVGQYLQEFLPPLFEESGRLKTGVELLTLGVSVPLETPLYWLALHASYFDQFLHLVVRVPSCFMVPDGD